MPVSTGLCSSEPGVGIPPESADASGSTDPGRVQARATQGPHGGVFPGPGSHDSFPSKCRAVNPNTSDRLRVPGQKRQGGRTPLPSPKPRPAAPRTQPWDAQAVGGAAPAPKDALQLQVHEKPLRAKGTTALLQGDGSPISSPRAGSVRWTPRVRRERLAKAGMCRGFRLGVGAPQQEQPASDQGTGREAPGVELFAAQIRARSGAGALTTTSPGRARRWLLDVGRLGPAPRAPGVSQQPPGQ